MGILAKLKSQSKVIEYLMGSSIRQITGWLQKEKVKYEYRYYKPTLTPFPKNQNTPQKPREIANLILLNADGDYKQALLSEGYEFNNIKLKEILQTKKLSVLSTADESSSQNPISEVIIDRNLLVELDEIFLKTSQESHYLSILAEEIKISPNVKILDLGLLPKYKAKVNFVSPLSKRETFVNHPHPFFGVSLENSNFNRPKLLASLEWIANRFSKCTVLIGDSIHRITLGLNENLSDESALKRSLTLGKDFLIDNLHVFKRFEKRCSFNFLFCSEIQGYKDYTDYHSYLKDLFKTDKKFKASVQAFSEDYHSKRQHSVPVEQWERLISGSCNYFLEEFAIFACLQKRGFSTMIYPGSFSTLSEIAAGLHGKALKELRELVVVSLQLKKR